MKTTLSTSQWQNLQRLFDQAERLDRAAADALITATRVTDAQVADALNAMLAAHHQWQSRTDAAIEGLIVAATPTAVGTQLGAYRLIKEIGRGGMGVVYLGERRDGQVQQQVAIKVLHTQNLDDNTRARFQREREILAAFDHPGIARLLDAGESAAGEPYYVMEYLRGLPIDAHCDQYKLGIRERLQLFQKVCDAVQYAHAQLILHRDIKPSNIVVDAAGAPKLIDFGIAKPIALLDAVAIEATTTQQRFFSPVSAAPEQIHGEAVSVTCDVYQLGVLLHEVLCGRPIFDLVGISAAELEQKICVITPDAPSIHAATANDSVFQARNLHSAQALSRALRGDLDAIVQRAIRKEPHLRYGSVEQFAQDIERHLQDQPVLGRRGGRAYRISRFVKRNWRGLGVAMSAVIGLGVFTALLMRQVQQTAAERDRAVVAGKQAEAVTAFLVEVFQTGDPGRALGPDAPIGAVLHSGRALLDRRLQSDPLTRARLFETLATIYVSLDDLEAAGELILQSVRLREETARDDPATFARQLQSAGAILMMNNRFDESKGMLSRAIALFDQLNYGVRESWYARLYWLRLLARDDEHEACKQMDDLSMRLFEIGPDMADEAARVLFSAAHCGPLTPARLSWLRAQANRLIAALSAGDQSTETSKFRTQQALVTILLRQRSLDEAERVNGENLERQRRVFGDQSWPVADAIFASGMVALLRSDFVEAQPMLLRAEERYVRLAKNRAHPDIAMVSHALARLHDQGTQNVEAAQEYFARAVDVGREGNGPGSTTYAEYATDYGLFLLKIDRLAQAESLLGDAIRILPATESYGARARIGLASILVARGESRRVRELLDIAPEVLLEAEQDDPGLGERLRVLRSTVR